MPKYNFVGTVERLVTDTIHMTVEAESELHAQAISEGILNTFPKAHTEDGCRYCYIDQRVHHDPVVISIEEVKKFA